MHHSGVVQETLIWSPVSQDGVARSAIAIRYNGKQKSANGRSYHSYTVGSDKPRAQFQWGKSPRPKDAVEPPGEDGESYRFGDGEPLPPEPDEPPF
jgi:hypothetical protein